MMLRNRLVLRGIQVACALGSLACAPEPSARANMPRAIGGTYELRLCRVRCAGGDEPNSLAIGRLVLAGVAIDTSAHIRSDSARRHLTLQDIWESDEGPPNGCFVWHQRREDPLSYGKTWEGALVHWSAKEDSLFFRLYRSPDASHSVRAVRTQTGFQGRGVSAGAGAAEVDWPDDVVVGRWIGPSDFAICNEAADSALSGFQRFIRERPALPKRLQN